MLRHQESLSHEHLAALPTVVLQHDLPDGSRHFDWMIASSPVRGSSLLTFRCPLALHWFSGQMTVQPIQDHRWEYLTFQGQLAGNRGIVKQLAFGKIGIFESCDGDAPVCAAVLMRSALEGRTLHIHWETQRAEKHQIARFVRKSDEIWVVFATASQSAMAQ